MRTDYVRISPAQILAGGGQQDIDYKLDRPPFTRYFWDGSAFQPAGGGAITNYTAAQLSALAAAGGLTAGATYVASDTGSKADARSSTTLDWPNAKVVSVAPGTGVANIDAAAINAALESAGQGGTVKLAANSVYSYGGKGGRILQRSVNAAPSLIDLNGSTLLHNGFVSTATTTGNYSAGSNVVVQLNVGGAANFAVGDYVGIYGANYSSNIVSKTTNITAVDYALDRITLSNLSFNSGTSTGILAAWVQHDDSIYFTNYPSALRSAEWNTVFCNGRVDGNAAVRIAAGLRQRWSLNSLVNVSSITFTARDIVFINAPCDALQGSSVPYLKVIGCHFENIFGNGIHPGASEIASIEVIVANNSFFNVTQATDVSVPTIDQFGHTLQSGAIINSIGPKQMIVVNNAIDTTTRAGFSAVTSTDTDYVISGNLFTNCGAGAFQVASGKNVAITGNHCVSCGRDANQASAGVKDQTTVVGNAGADQNVTITGNTLIDTPLFLTGDAAAVVVSGNVLNTSGLTNPTGNTNANFIAALTISFSGIVYGPSRVSVTGNLIINPVNAASSLNGILLSRGKDVSIVGNTIIGGRFGITASSGSGNPLINVRVAENIFSDQGIAGGGANPASIYWAVGSCSNCSIENNTISTVDSSTVTMTAIFLFSNSYAASSLRVCGNSIRSSTTRLTGIKFNTAINYTGSNITVADNDIELVNVADAPFVVPTTGTLSGIFFLMNRMRGGSGIPAWGTCVSTIGGGTDSNWAV